MPKPTSPGDRVDTPFGLGIVREVAFHEELREGPYVLVELEAKGMTVDDMALLDLGDVERFRG